jgi:alpha-ketoglutarate-dependent taurine dioxygenase
MGSANFEIQPVAGRIGAEIRGVDLSAALSDDLIREIRQALVQYKVIFFRQQTLDEKSHTAFASRFGSLTTAHPTVPAYFPEHPAVFDLDYSRQNAHTNRWHTDVTFVDHPPLGSILRALVVPPYGGDTVWANTATAYTDLPPHLQALADQLWVVHSNGSDYAAATVDIPESAREYSKVFQSTIYETLHPAVQVHPESGERSLLLGGFARRIKGLTAEDSHTTLQLLQSYVTRLENTVRWRWQVGDVAFWDNRATQHYAIADYGNQPRRVQRVTVAGVIPTSIDGQRSKVIKGDSTAYIPAQLVIPQVAI